MTITSGKIMSFSSSSSSRSRSMMSLMLVLCLVAAMVDASGCHGNSRFRLASVTYLVEDWGSYAPASMEEKHKMCQIEYGRDATLMDLEQMEGEFQNPSDLQHALNPLFDEDDLAIFLIADHGKDSMTSASEHDAAMYEYTLVKEPVDFETNENVMKSVAGQVFMESRTVEELTRNGEYPLVLCYIPKPKYDPETVIMDMKNMKGMESSKKGMMMNNPMESSSNYRDSATESTMMYQEVNETSSNQSVLVYFLGLVAVGAAGMAAFQTYKKRMASQGSLMMAPSLDLGGSYSILSGGDNDTHQQLTQQLSPTNLELA